MSKPSLSGADLERIYRSLRLIRRVEEEVARIYPSDKIKSPVHLSIGQEAIATGVCDALDDGDIVSGTYRGHAAYLAKGGDLQGMFAELYGKRDGCSGGKGGSMHMVDMPRGVLGNSAVVGSTVPIAMGYAFAQKRQRTGKVVAAFFGDGATEEGVFWESVNFSVLHRLPILFVCENNGLAIHTPLEKRWAVPDLLPKVEAFGLRADLVHDGDVFAIREKTAEAVETMRAGDAGPALLECRTYRWKEHVGPGEDYDAGYRTPDDKLPWVENDQVARVGAMLDTSIRERADSEIEDRIADAIAFAESSPFPGAEDLFSHVYAS
ncbi:MAG: thiamine pyrophosphate-dependent dehydrogenase E1 component subunit alpha [Bauldia litoralis]